MKDRLNPDVMYQYIAVDRWVSGPSQCAWCTSDSACTVTRKTQQATVSDSACLEHARHWATLPSARVHPAAKLDLGLLDVGAEGFIVIPAHQQYLIAVIQESTFTVLDYTIASEALTIRVVLRNLNWYGIDMEAFTSLIIALQHYLALPGIDVDLYYNLPAAGRGRVFMTVSHGVRRIELREQVPTREQESQ
jgi:hypothetical protein